MSSSNAPPLIDALLGLARDQDRGALAALRRGLGQQPGTVPAMFPYVEPYLGGNPTRSREEASYLVAALFASHPLNWAQEGPIATNVGASLARIAGRSDSIEKRFQALLACRREDLPDHLRHLIALLRGHDIPVDWSQLLRDIQFWDAEDRRVQRAWARALWGRMVESTSESQ